MRKLLRFIVFVGVVAGAVWALRDKLLPPPRPPVEPPPAFRRTPSAAPAVPPPPRPPSVAPTKPDETAPPPPSPSAPAPEPRPSPAPSVGSTPEAVADDRAGAGTLHDEGSAVSAATDDLTAIKGIGPVFAERLHKEGITSFGALVGADAAAVATRIDVSEAQVADWIRQARQLVY